MGIHDRQYYQDETPSGLAPSWNNRSAIASIIILNVAVFLADFLLTSQSHAINRFLALESNDLREPWMWWRLLTYGFTHSHDNIGHIFWNMLGLWMLGRSVEELYGRAEFLKIYLGCLLFCGAAWLLLHSTYPQASSVIGASGAVCCIEMLFVFNFPRVILMIWGIVPTPAWVVGALLVLGNIFVDPSDRSTAFDVHIFGILFATGYFFLHWNFSRMAIPSTRMWWRKMTGPRLKVHAPTVGEDQEMDRLLKKIHDQGPDSLTRAEKKFMEKCARRLREKRQES